MKVKEALSWGTQTLEAEKISSPRLDSEVLLMYNLNLTRTRLYLDYERELTNQEEADYRKLISRRIARVPVAYLTGKKEFMSLELQVDSRVLIPRPETELLVERVLEEMKEYSSPVRVLDIGTGSGAIALSLAYYSSDGNQIYALDYSEEALQVARTNAGKLGLTERVKFLHGNLWAGMDLELDNNYFQVIISNPPYISQGEMLTLEREVLDYEPHLALVAGSDGLDFYRRISQGLPDYLAPGGLVALEVGKGQADLVKELLENTKIFSKIKVLPDYAGIERIVMAWREK
mgnify:CR=1 FL=1